VAQAAEALTDEELKAVIASGDSALLRQLSPEERARVQRLTPYTPRNVLAEGRASAATNGQPEATGEPGLLERLRPMLESAVTRNALRGQHCCHGPPRFGPWVIMTELSEREAGSSPA